MKALKKLSFSFFIAVLCAALFVAPATALAEGSSAAATTGQVGTYVFDERGLFTAEQFQTLEATGAELAQSYGMGVYFLTTGYMNGLSDPSSSQRTDYATAYYRDHGLGLNKGENSIGDGIMFVIAADSRDYVTVAYGQGSYSFNDKGIAAMESDVKSNLSNNNWYEAARTYYGDIGAQLQYYSVHGKPQQRLGMLDWVIRLFIIVGIPLIVTFFIINGWRSAMRTAVEKSEAGNYLDRNSVKLTHSRDQFIRTTLVATPKPKNEDKGGGGGWGGGGGGGFSSSGGGKF